MGNIREALVLVAPEGMSVVDGGIAKFREGRRGLGDSDDICCKDASLALDIAICNKVDELNLPLALKDRLGSALQEIRVKIPVVMCKACERVSERIFAQRS